MLCLLLFVEFWFLTEHEKPKLVYKRFKMAPKPQHDIEQGVSQSFYNIFWKYRI